MTTELTVIIPCYNEEKYIYNQLIKIQESIDKMIIYEIILINDGSSDKSINEINRFLNDNKLNNFILIENEKNLGKSNSVIKGINLAKGKYFVIQDADNEYDPADLNFLYMEGRYKDFDVIYGNRFGQYNPVVHWHGFYGNQALTLLLNFFSLHRIKTYIGDMHTCYKMIRTEIALEVIKDLNIQDSFALDTIITVKLTKYKRNNEYLKFINLPISYYPRNKSEGKKLNPISDGIKCVYNIIKYNIF